MVDDKGLGVMWLGDGLSFTYRSASVVKCGTTFTFSYRNLIR